MDKFDHNRVNVFPLRERKSLTQVEEIIIDPSAPTPPFPEGYTDQLDQCVSAVKTALKRKRSILLFYGAHLLRNGAALILEQMMTRGWVTHLATNGAGTIHDWEYAWLGKSTESVRENVPDGVFGTWDETGKHIHVALLAGGLEQRGYGSSLGSYIENDGTHLPSEEALVEAIQQQPTNPENGPKAELLRAYPLLRDESFQPGSIPHPWKKSSILAAAFRHQIPLTVHPGIGYDIIATHPIFNGAAIGRAAEMDFKAICQSIDELDGGVVLSIGSAIMAPQVFEKALSCVNNVRIRDGRPTIKDHQIFIVDLQDGGQWDWTQGEPPKTNPAYYLRFCKSFARMGGSMHYLQCDNMVFLQNLYQSLL